MVSTALAGLTRFLSISIRNSWPAFSLPSYL